jgi:RNA polymerase sigma-70 factor (ECF subfamily)
MRTPERTGFLEDSAVRPHSVSGLGHESFDSLPPRKGNAILLCQEFEVLVEFFAFDKEYVERLRDGDHTTEHHFVAYFEQLLRIKLRSRTLTSDKVEDLRQETFIRVIAALRREGGVRQPERFGAFVNSICNNVLLEYYRSSSRNQPMEDVHLEIPDKVLDLEGMLITKQSSEHVRRILEEMPQKDRDLLRRIFLEEKDKDAVCQEFGVDREYLRVLVHRAKDKFKVLYEKDQVGIGGRGMNRGIQ